MSMFIGVDSVQRCATMQLIYDYVSPSPQAYGSGTMKTVESIARINEYSTQNGELDKIYLHDFNKLINPKPNGNPYGHFLDEMVNELVIRWSSESDSAKLSSIVQSALLMPASKLTKAKQTLSFCDGMNNGGAWEWSNLNRTLAKNLEQDPSYMMVDTLHSYCIGISKLSKLKIIMVPFYTENGGVCVENWNAMTNSEFLKICRCINTMLKTGERGKLKRRMIASATMFCRPFVAIAEEITKGLLEADEFSVIHIGGEEKKEKLESLCSDFCQRRSFLVVSGDVTKWNEALSPHAMGYYLSEFLIEIMEICENLDESLFQSASDIVNVAYGMFGSKNIMLGDGIPFKTKNKLYTYMVPASQSFDKNCNTEMRENFKKLKKEDILNVHFPNQSEVKEAYHCKFSMLMGMFNLGSTLYAIGVLRTRPYKNSEMYFSHKQSSDDFESFYGLDQEKGPLTRNKMMKAFEYNRRKWKMMGINISPEKTLVVSNVMIGELTSMYHTDVYWGNLSVDLPGIVPQGVDPYNDVNLTMKFLHNIALRNSIEMAGLHLAIRLYFKFYDAAYQLSGSTMVAKLNDYIKSRYGNNVLYANKGIQIYSPTTVGFGEIAMRTRPMIDISKFARIPMSDEYLKIIMTPIEKDAAVVAENILVDGRRPYMMPNSIPYCIYCIEYRKNEKTQKRKGMISKERECARLSNLILEADKAFGISTSKACVDISQSLLSKAYQKICLYKSSGGTRANELAAKLAQISNRNRIITGFGELGPIDNITLSSGSIHNEPI